MAIHPHFEAHPKLRDVQFNVNVTTVDVVDGFFFYNPFSFFRNHFWMVHWWFHVTQAWCKQIWAVRIASFLSTAALEVSQCFCCQAKSCLLTGAQQLKKWVNSINVSNWFIPCDHSLTCMFTLVWIFVFSRCLSWPSAALNGISFFLPSHSSWRIFFLLCCLVPWAAVPHTNSGLVWSGIAFSFLKSLFRSSLTRLTRLTRLTLHSFWKKTVCVSRDSLLGEKQNDQKKRHELSWPSAVHNKNWRIFAVPWCVEISETHHHLKGPSSIQTTTIVAVIVNCFLQNQWRLKFKILSVKLLSHFSLCAHCWHGVSHCVCLSLAVLAKLWSWFDLPNSFIRCLLNHKEQLSNIAS